MSSYQATWEDDENNRKISIDVAFERRGDEIEISEVTPKQVTFLCPETAQPLRSIGVHTDAGRSLLSRIYRSTDHAANLCGEILEKAALATV